MTFPSLLRGGLLSRLPTGLWYSGVLAPYFAQLARGLGAPRFRCEVAKVHFYR
jgi:hypothetical protein